MDIPNRAGRGDRAVLRHDLGVAVSNYWRSKGRDLAISIGYGAAVVLAAVFVVVVWAALVEYQNDW